MPPRDALDTTAWLHQPLIQELTQKRHHYEQQRKHNLQTRFIRAEHSGFRQRAQGDVLLERVESLFLNGFGIDWSEVQVRIFRALIDSCLPRIYGNEWEKVKSRVMRERGLDRLQQETLVNMARRNGKTWVVSGAAAALFLVVPDISIAVFSVGKRQAGMFMTAAIEKMEMALQRGTHVKSQGYTQVQRNQETLIYLHPDGGKQVLGCYPGSVKVSCQNQAVAS